MGPRVVGLTATSLWAGGLAVASAGCFTHTLPLVYLGYSFLGGAGWGLGYSAVRRVRSPPPPPVFFSLETADLDCPSPPRSLWLP